MGYSELLYGEEADLEVLRARDAAAESHYEIVRGERRELEPMGALECILAFELGFYLRDFARKHQLGLVATEMLFILDADEKLQRRPDVAFVAYQRWPEPRIPLASGWKVAPDLAVEVVSPTNLAPEVESKVIDYFAHGVRLVWVIYPETERVYVYESSTSVNIRERADALDGADVLPGFQLLLATLFEAGQRPESDLT